MIKAQRYRAKLPRRSKTKTSPFTLEEKFAMVARCNLKGEDPNDVVPPFFERYGRTAPKYPAQALSAMMCGLERLIESGDEEAIALAKEWDWPIEEVEDWSEEDEAYEAHKRNLRGW